MPSYMTSNQNSALVLPPPVVLSNPKAAESWFLTRSPQQRQTFMAYVTNTINGMTAFQKRQFSNQLAKRGLTLDMMKQDFPGLQGLGDLGLLMDFMTLGTSLLLAKDAQNAAADQSKDQISLQRELGKKQIAADERMNQALINAKVAAAGQAADSANKATELSAYLQILNMQQKAKKDEQRREMFGPVWAGVIKWGGLGVLVVGGGATFMYMRQRRKRRK